MLLRRAWIGVSSLVAIAAGAGCERRIDERLGVGLLEEPVERGTVEGPAGPLGADRNVTVCTRLLLMPRARCDGWATARGGAITGTQLHSLVRMQARLDRVKRLNALRLGPKADPNIHGAPVPVDETPTTDVAPLVVRDDHGHWLLFVDATAH